MIDSSVFQDKIATYYTLGCKLNFSETSTFAQMLSDMGVRQAETGEAADICLINTCSVTDVADHKCRQAINRMVRNNPGALVVVTGCYAQLQPEKISKMDGVDLVLGANEKASLIDFLNDAWTKKQSLNVNTPSKESNLHNYFSVSTKDIKTFTPSCSRGNRTRYFLKVQDGCDYFCTYCTIPYARGRSRNGEIGRLVDMARTVAAEGGKEIVITGVNVGDFGKTTGETFLDLIRALDEVEGIERYRISSIEPDLLTPQMIDFVASSRRFMPHFHLPLQAGSDEVLRLMHRRYDTALFAGRVHYIKEVMPHAFIGVDVIAGARGETDPLFDKSYDFIAGLDVSQLHVFPYSERPGTAALRIDGAVAPATKHSRCAKLQELSDSKLLDFYSKHVGTTARVLLEHSKTPGVLHGFTENYIKTEVDTSAPLDNTVVNVRLGALDAGTRMLKAAIIDGQ